MILFDKTQIFGWEPAIRGMRNPMNSWDRSDSSFDNGVNRIGSEDRALMQKLADAGQCHGKYLRMIVVTVDITAPMYWWQEFDTYKVGTVRNSCSKMHKLLSRKFEADDFSHEYIAWSGKVMSFFLDQVLTLNELRDQFMKEPDPKIKKRIWCQILQLLPVSYNQKSTVMLNYAVLKNIYEYRKDHKLDEWKDFCRWIRSLPHSELITGRE